MPILDGADRVKRRVAWLGVAMAAVAIVVVSGAAAQGAPVSRNLRLQPPDMWAFGSAPNDDLGWSLAQGDINGDGFPDFASGAILAENRSVTPIQYQQGALHVYFGKTNFQGIRDSSKPGSPDLIVYGVKGEGGNLQKPKDSDNLGKGVSLEDLNGDGIGDLAVSSMNADSTHGFMAGVVYIFFGRPTWPAVIDLSQNPNAADVTIQGDVLKGTLGTTLKVGDFDGDGMGDLLMGAPGLTRTNGSVGNGDLRLVYGSTSWPTSLDLAAPPAGMRVLKIHGAALADRLGQSLGVGDLNGDGIDDFAAGAFRGNEICGPEAEGGKAFAFYGAAGAAAPVGLWNLATTPADYSVYWAQAGDQLGRRVSVGDVSGDGQADLILGARCGDFGGRVDTGEVHVLFGPLGHGSQSLSSDPADVTVAGVDPADYFGVGVLAGDANGDGVGDLIAGANGGDGWKNGAPETGEASILNGPVAAGTYDLHANPADVTIFSPDGGDRLGRFLAMTDANADCVPEVGLTAYGSGGATNRIKFAGEVDLLSSPGGAPAPGTVCVFAGDPAAAEAGLDSGAFTIARTGPVTAPLSVSYTLSGQASNGVDFVSLPGSVTIPAGASKVSVPVSVLQDGVVESSENVVLKLTGGAGVHLGSPRAAKVTIADNDVPVTVTRVGSGAGTVSSSPGGISCGVTCAATFSRGSPVTLTATPDSGSVFAGWSGACSGSGTCVLPLDSGASAISVSAAFASSSGTGPPLAPTNVVATVGSSGSGVTLTWNPPASDGGAPITSYVVSRGPDAAHLSPLATVDASVLSLEDDDILSGATYVYSVSAVNFMGQGPDAQVTAAVPQASVSIGPAKGVEADSGTTVASFPITLSHESAGPVSVLVSTVAGRATPGSDFVALSSAPVTIPAGETFASVDVQVIGDAAFEGTELFTVQLSGVTGASMGAAQATGTIVDNEGPITVSARDSWVQEGNAGPASLQFTLELSAAPDAGQQVSVKAATAAGSATSGVDYTAVPLTTISFAPGQTFATVAVPVQGDTSLESNETVLLNVSSPSNSVVIADSQALGTIVEDDGVSPAPPAPSVSVSDAWVVEGNLGQTSEVFSVTLSQPSATTVTVVATTAPGSAAREIDYLGVGPMTLTFAPGQVSNTVSVPVVGDTDTEPDQSYWLKLSAPSGASIGDVQGLGTIADDD